MTRGRLRFAAAWLVAVLLGALAPPTALGQGVGRPFQAPVPRMAPRAVPWTPVAQMPKAARQQQFDQLEAEFQRVTNTYQPPGAYQPQAEDQLALRLVRFAEAGPKDWLAFQALELVFSLKHAPPPPRAIELMLEHHLNRDGFGRMVDYQWDFPTPARYALLRRLVEVETLAPKMRATVALYLARDTFKEAGETGDRDLARRALRYAEQFEKQYPQPPNHIVGQAHPTQVLWLLDAIRKTGVGQPAPAIRMDDVLGRPFDLAALRGRVVIVCFYGGPGGLYPRMRDLFAPHLARLKGRPVALVLVPATNDGRLKENVELDPAPPPVLPNPLGPYCGDFQKGWALATFPTTVLVDAQGTIRYHFGRYNFEGGPPNDQPLHPRFGASLDLLVAEAVQR
jgi:hypothetical protein